MRNAQVHDQYIIKLEIQKSFNYWCYYDKLNNIVSTIFFVKQSFLQRYQQQNLMHHFNVCTFKLLSCTFMLAVSHNNPQLPLVNHPKRQLIQYPNLSLQSLFCHFALVSSFTSVRPDLLVDCFSFHMTSCCQFMY